MKTPHKRAVDLFPSSLSTHDNLDVYRYSQRTKRLYFFDGLVKSPMPVENHTIAISPGFLAWCYCRLTWLSVPKIWSCMRKEDLTSGFGRVHMNARVRRFQQFDQ